MNSTEKCQKCRGSGWYYGPDEREVTCACEHRRRIRLCLARHGLEAATPVVTTTPLLKVAKHAMVKGSWGVVRQHVAGWLAHAYLRDPHVTIAILNDTEVRDLWLGKRPGSSKEGASLLDDVLGGHKLVVVRLRHVRHGATGSALAELLDVGPAVWMCETSGRDFVKGHPSHSPEVEGALEDVGYEVVDLGDADNIDLDSLLGGGQ